VYLLDAFVSSTFLNKLLYILRISAYVSLVVTGQSLTGYCNECKVNLEPDCSLHDHQRSRKHINRLLQLGIEVPISCINQTEENQIPEGSIVFHLLTIILFDYIVYAT